MTDLTGEIEIIKVEMTGMEKELEESSLMVQKRLAGLKEKLEKRKKRTEARTNKLKQQYDIDTDPDWY